MAPPAPFISSPEKKSRFMKWLNKHFISWPSRSGDRTGGCNSGRRPQLLEEENIAGWRPLATSLDEHSRAGKEKEETDNAMRAEDWNRSGYRSRTDNDEELARALQDSVNQTGYPPNASPQSYHRGYRLCDGCRGDLGNGTYLACMGKVFHPNCFRCTSCGNPITENEFCLSGGDPYHKFCFNELAHPKCEVCHQHIPTNDAGLIEYRCLPFWFQKYCLSHEHDNTARCCSCQRLEPWNTSFYRLEDGRSLCLECMESAILDIGEGLPLYFSIRDFYEGMNMKLDQQIPMFLVERQALNEAIAREKNGYYHIPETRGLCLSEEQTITTIQRRPICVGKRLLGIRTQPQKLTRKSCGVTAILALYGLPRLLTGAIIAHELMHGWLRLQGYRNLNPEVEEGICQVLSYMWLESEVLPLPSTSGASSSKKGSKSSVENKLGEFFMHQIAKDALPEYGGGFGAANAAVNKYGLRRTLDHIRLTGNFPL